MRDPRDARVEAALTKARSELGWFHRYGALAPGDDHMRPVAQHVIMHSLLPDEVRDYLLRLLDEKPASSSSRSGRPSNAARDHWIVLVLAHLVVKHGLPLTRNRSRKDRPRWTACRVVAVVLAELGVKLSEVAIETIWSKRRPQRSPLEINDDDWLVPED
jgi:hypothetical protein